MHILYLFEAVYIKHVLSLGKEGLECSEILDVGGPSWIDFMYFLWSNKKQRSCDGREEGEARSAPFKVAMSSKRRVRAAHGRAREARTH
jgi:hypothetical protein